VLHSELVYIAERCARPKLENDVKTTRRNLRGRPKPGEWKMYIDAKTGETIERQKSEVVNGKGRVFDPNPVVT